MSKVDENRRIKTGGRTKGTPNKKTAEIQKAVAESGITPLEYMIQVMRDPATEPKEKLSAAIAAAPYVHPKLSSVEMNATVTTHESVIDDLA